MNNIKTASAIILAFCTAITFFTACGNKEEGTTTTSSSTLQATTQKIITPDGSELIAVSQDENYTYYMPPETKNNSVSFSFAAPPTENHVSTTAKPSETTAKTHTNTTTVKTTKADKTTTRRASSGGEVEEIAEGITVVTKTSPVNVGNSATIMIHGTPGKKHTIEFYETTSKKAGYDGLTEKTADSNGFVSWTFVIENSCEAGNRKIIVREKGSDNFVQTSITVN